MSGSWNSQMLNWMKGSPQGEPVLLDCKSMFITASGDSLLWTPTSGKSIRLTKLNFSVPGNTTKTVGSILHITIKTSTKSWGTFSVWIPSTLGALLTSPASAGSGNINLGQGFEAPIDDPLTINMSTSVDNGGVRINAYGCEM